MKKLFSKKVLKYKLNKSKPTEKPKKNKIMMIKMKPKIVIHSYNKSRWKHSSYKEKAHKNINKIYPDLKYHGKLLELQLRYPLNKH